MKGSKTIKAELEEQPPLIIVRLLSIEKREVAGKGKKGNLNLISQVLFFIITICADKVWTLWKFWPENPWLFVLVTSLLFFIAETSQIKKK